MDAIALLLGQQWAVCPIARLIRLPGVRENILGTGLSKRIALVTEIKLTGPMSLRVLSSSTVSMGDLEGSTEGGLTSVAPGMVCLVFYLSARFSKQKQIARTRVFKK